MSESAARVAHRDEARPSGSWPHALGQEPTLRVGDVLAALQGEFPSLSPSKLRFLDAQGLVCPHRSASGYRHYSVAHIERLRYVLRQQRDAYVPLSVIKERLIELDDGRAHEPVSLSAVSDAGGTITLKEAAAVANSSVETIAALIDEGVIDAAAPGCIARPHMRLTVAAAHFLDTGADIREVRALVRVAQREHEAASRAAAPLRRRDDVAAAASAVASRVEAAQELFAAAITHARDEGE